MIDTLKLSKRLTAAHMPPEQAEALADGLAESLKETCVTREFFDSRRAEDRAFLETKLASLRIELIMWMVGTVALGALANHFFK